MTDSSKPAVPRFASFRPKAPVTRPGDPPQSARVDGEEASEVKRHRRNISDDVKGRHSRHDHREKPSRHGRPPIDKHGNSAGGQSVAAHTDSLRQELLQNSSNIYRIDLKGDVDNLRYHSLHSYAIPKYNRYGRGRVLGAKSAERISKVVPNEKAIILAPLDRSAENQRPLLRYARRQTQPILRLIKPDSSNDSASVQRDFLEFPAPRMRSRRSESPFSETSEPNYRSTEGRAKNHTSPDDPDFEYASDTSASDLRLDKDRAIRQANIALVRRTKDEPNNIDAWLQLIEGQAAALGLAHKSMTNLDVQALADVRCSIFEQALQVVEDRSARAELTLGLLNEGSKIWATHKLKDRWLEAKGTFPARPKVRFAYLNFIQSHHGSFRFESCRDEFIDVLSMLAADVTTDITEPRVYAFLRFTTFLRDSGYHELAEALWQSVLELHFFRPSALQSLEDSFEEFWESEVPRIGEIGSRGWCNYDPEIATVPLIRVESTTIPGAGRLFHHFAIAERESMKHQMHPGRTGDETGDDDPFHIILYSDVKAILFPYMQGPTSKDALLSGFLRFLGLPNWGLPAAHLNAWWTDPFLHTSSKSEPQIRCYLTTPESLFANMFQDLCIADIEWTNRALHRLVEGYTENIALAEYYVALQHYLDPAKGKKAAKRLLKARSASMRLYNCYGIIESREMGADAGGRIFSTAIKMATSLENYEQRCTVLLYRTWIWELIRIGDFEQAHRLLDSIGSDSLDRADMGTNAVDDLRSARWLKDGLQTELNAGLRVLFAELTMLKYYFKSQQSLDAALSYADQAHRYFGTFEPVDSQVMELLQQAIVQLVELHLKHFHVWKPSIVRAALEKSIRMFPHNTLMLEAYGTIPVDIIIGSHSIIDDVVLANGSNTIVGWSWAISMAEHRAVELGGTTHKVRDLCERAISSLQHPSVHIWSRYLAFEVRHEEFNKAKAVFLRGIREMPWAKWWIIFGLEHLADVLAFEEARSVWNVLAERELRVQVDIEGLVEQEWVKRLEQQAATV